MLRNSHTHKPAVTQTAARVVHHDSSVHTPMMRTYTAPTAVRVTTSLRLMAMPYFTSPKRRLRPW